MLTPIVLMILFQLVFIFYLNENIRNELIKNVSRSTEGEYNLNIEKVNVNLFKRSIGLSGFSLAPAIKDSSRVYQYTAAADYIVVDKFYLYDFLLKKKIIAQRLLLVHPIGVVTRGIMAKDNTDKQLKPRLSIYELIKDNIVSLAIQKIEIHNAALKIYNDHNDSLPAVSSYDNDIHISNFNVNAEAQQMSRLFLADSVGIALKNISFNTGNALYTIKAKSITSSYLDSILLIDSFEIVPKFGKKQFAAKAGWQTDRLSISAAHVRFNQMHVKLFFERNWLIAGKMSITELNVHAFRDKNYKRSSKRPPSVQEIVREIPFYTLIDSIKIEHGNILYEELAEKAEKAGKLFIDKLDALITDVSNDKKLMKENNAIRLNASCRIMKNGTLTAHYIIPMNTNKMVYDCYGKLNGLDLKSLNVMLEPNVQAMVKSGVIDSMIFKFHANDSFAKGTMKLAYHDFEVELLNKKDKQGALQNIFSFFANAIFIKKDNPDAKGGIRITDINYERDPTRFIFNYSWKSLLSGIKPAVGIPEIKNPRYN